MTPTQQALALDALRDLCAMNAQDVHDGLTRYAKGSATDKMWKRARIAIASLEAAPAAPAEFIDTAAIVEAAWELAEQETVDGVDSAETEWSRYGEHCCRLMAEHYAKRAATAAVAEPVAVADMVGADLADMIHPGTLASCLDDALNSDIVVTAKEVACARALLFLVSGSALMDGDKKAVKDAGTLYRMVCAANNLLIGRVPPAEPSVEVVLPDACGVVGLSAERFVGGYVGTETIPFTLAPQRPEAMLFKELALGTLLVTRDECRAYGDARAAAAILADRAARVREPLKHMQIVLLWGHRSDGPSNAEIVSFARAIERAHGIGITPTAPTQTTHTKE